jgi:hypothetical protein
MLVKLSADQRTFATTFAREHTAPHARQYEYRGERTDWSTYDQPTNDRLIAAHLNGELWLGTRGSWYPTVWNLDIDSPTSEKLDKIYKRLNYYEITGSRRVTTTSPSFKAKGSRRIYFKLEERNRPITFTRGYEVLKNTFADICEVYPQKNRVDRLPCGKYQDLIDDDGRVLSRLSWKQEMDALLKITPTAAESLRYQFALLPEPPLDPTDQPRSWKPKAEIAELIEYGLQPGGMRRSEAQYEILNYYWRANVLPFEAAEKVKTWIQTKNNGLSGEVNVGRMRQIEAHIDRQTAWIYARPAPIYPDATEGLQGALTRADLKFAAELYPASAVRQKQLAALCAYYRPRRHHEFVFIPVWYWREQIANDRTYKAFVAELVSKDLLTVDRYYQQGEFCRRYKLSLPKTTEQPIQRDSRPVTDFYEALAQVYSRREIAQLTGINERTLRRHFREPDRTKYAA